MNNELIGGIFGFVDLLKIEGQIPPFLGGRELLLCNARSGINVLSSLLKPQVVWVPSFLCDVMLKAVQNLDVRFYEVDSDLQISREWLDNVQKGELVVFIDYFGFPFDPSLAVHIKQRGG